MSIDSSNMSDLPKKGDAMPSEAEINRVATVDEGQSSNLKKDLGALTLLAICFNICNSWAGLSGSMQLALLQGGPVTLLYGMIISASVYMAIALTMGELISVYPTAGGQYHFTSILAPRRFNRGLSYACGIVTNFSWIAIGAAVTVIPSQQVTAFAVLFHPSYEPKPWHIFLIYEGFGIVVLIYNLFVIKKLPRTHDVGLALTISLFIASTLALFIRANPKASSEFVWTTFTNYTGWSDGVCFMTALLTTCFIFAGLDASMHLSEEAANPRKSVPKAGVMAIGIGAVTAFIYAIAILYSISDFEAILTLDGYVPLAISLQGMRSRDLAVTLQAFGTVMAFFVLNAIYETTSRITWSLARDDALIFSKYMSRVHPTLHVPVASVIVNWAIVSICGVLLLFSSIAFNALVASCVVLQQMSFLFPTALNLYRKRSEEFLPKSRAFYLPQWLGYACNIWVVVMTSLMSVFFCLPPFRPVTADNMNYTCVILGFAGLLCVINWFLHARRKYQGPRIELAD